MSITLAAIKPSVALHQAYVQRILDRVAASSLVVVRQRLVRWDRPTAERFYQEHADRFFFERLVGYTSSGPMLGLVLGHRSACAVQAWRSLLGPTKTYRAKVEAPDSLRGLYGVTDTRNCAHGADSEAAVRRELPFFFDEPYEELLAGFLAEQSVDGPRIGDQH